jgi:hypothetical protein
LFEGLTGNIYNIKENLSNAIQKNDVEVLNNYDLDIVFDLTKKGIVLEESYENVEAG